MKWLSLLARLLFAIVLTVITFNWIWWVGLIVAGLSLLGLFDGLGEVTEAELERQQKAKAQSSPVKANP